MKFIPVIITGGNVIDGGQFTFLVVPSPKDSDDLLQTTCDDRGGDHRLGDFQIKLIIHQILKSWFPDEIAHWLTIPTDHPLLC